MVHLTFFQLPEEILHYVYYLSGNQAEHKKNTVKLLKFNQCIKIMDRFQKQCMYRQNHISTRYFGYYHMLDIIIHNNCQDDLEKKKLFDGLKDCKCCDRHNDNVPNEITDTWDEVIVRGARETPNCCACKCRHYKRRLSCTIKRDSYVPGYFSAIMD